MPDFSLHIPRSLRIKRLRLHSSKGSPLRPGDDVSVSQSLGASVSLALSSSPVFSASLEQGIEVTAATNPSSATDQCVGPQNLTVASVVHQPAQHMRSTPSQQTSNSELPSFSSPLLPSELKQGILNQAHNFTMMGPTLFDGNRGCVTITNNNTSTNSSHFMEKLLENTIPGAEFDSSARDPPPRCHPGTRLAVLERCISFISNCSGIQKIRWIFGAAGVGKSAILQNVAESHNLPVDYHASVFFSFDERNDGRKAILTISYQFAAKSELYRQIIEQEIARDPSILRSSMEKQFKKLIVEPFIHCPSLKTTSRVLIIIDGMDECDDTHVQLELLRLITGFCATHPSSPLVWLIASRPETHITTFFSRNITIPLHEREEILINSDEARADVERFLRDKLMEIKETLDSADPQWPTELDLWLLADAASGLFAYVDTAIRYIGDSKIGSPVSQFSDVLNVIRNHPMKKGEHPMAPLDALYKRILSNVPDKIMDNTRKLLLVRVAIHTLAASFCQPANQSFVSLCNWLGLTPDEAYAAVNHLRSVLYVPRRDKAHLDNLRPFHKSFNDFIQDFNRSGFSENIQHEARLIRLKCALRVLEQAPDGIDFGDYDDVDYGMFDGRLARGTGNREDISLSWSVDEVGWDNNGIRLNNYKLAIGEILHGIALGDNFFGDESFIRLATNRFETYTAFFPFRALHDLAFHESRRSEFVMHGILTQVPLEFIDMSRMSLTLREVKLRFRRSTTTVKNQSDPWDPSCWHCRKGKWGEGKDHDWTTMFVEAGCTCFNRLERQLVVWKACSPKHTALVLFTSTVDYSVEIRFVDVEDGMSEWTYWFWLALLPEQREEYGKKKCGKLV